MASLPSPRTVHFVKTLGMTEGMASEPEAGEGSWRWPLPPAHAPRRGLAARGRRWLGYASAVAAFAGMLLFVGASVLYSSRLLSERSFGWGTGAGLAGFILGLLAGDWGDPPRKATR